VDTLRISSKRRIIRTLVRRGRHFGFMNSKIVLTAIIIILLLAVAGGILYASKESFISKLNQSAQSVTPEVTITPTISQKMQSSKGSLKSLLTSSQSLQCTFSTQDENNPVKGTVYVSNGKMRGDFQTGVMEKIINSHLIVDDNFSYFWTDESKRGIKMENNPLDSTSSAIQPTNQGLDVNQNYNLVCDNWTADKTLLTIPTDVTFSSFNIPTLKPSTAVGSDSASQHTGSDSNCNVCNSIPAGEARDTCLNQFNCQ